MTDDHVRAELRAIRALRDGVGCYAEQVRDALGSARRSVSRAETDVRNEVEGRRREHDGAVYDLEAARAALRSAPPDAQAACARAVAAAEERLARCQRRLDRGLAAERLISEASADVGRALQSADSVVSQQGSAATSILATLDGRLASAHSTRIAGIVTGLAVAAGTMTDISGVAQAVGNVSQGSIPTTQTPPTSLAQYIERRTQAQQEQYADNAVELAKREGRDKGRRERR